MSGQIFGKYSKFNFHENPPEVGVEFHAERRTDGREEANIRSS